MWIEDIVLALRSIGGEGHLSDIYDAIHLIRPNLIGDWRAVVRREIQARSSDSRTYRHDFDLFYSSRGIGRGYWGLREFGTPTAADLDDTAPERIFVQTHRVLRDTALARLLKVIHDHRCQLCGERIGPEGGDGYSEGHHIRPLGRPHNGPDVAGNIIILCPNHHSMLDLGMIPLKMDNIRPHDEHAISENFIEYHNTNIYGPSRYKIM